MKREITVKTASVYDPRFLAELVGVANVYTSHISIAMDGRSVNVKSIMGVMGLGLDQDKQITIEAEGNDEAEAITALEDFLTK